MSGIFDLSVHPERLRYTLHLPTKAHRRIYLESVRKDHGEAARQRIIDALKAKVNAE